MVKSRVFFCGLDKKRYHFVAAKYQTSENNVTKSLFSLSVFAKTIFKNKTGKDRDSGGFLMRDRGCGLSHIAHLKLILKIWKLTDRLKRTSRNQFSLSFFLYKYFASLLQTWILFTD